MAPGPNRRGDHLDHSLAPPRVGVKLPSRIVTPGEFLADAEAYEAAGADSLWVGPDAFRPADDAREVAGLDPWTRLAAIAAVTHRVQLGTSVAIIAQWPPLLFAQMLASLEQLSRGRMIIGAGAGDPSQLEAVGIPSEQGAARLGEFIEVVRAIWRGEPKAFEGRFYRKPATWAVRSARDGGPPILIAGLLEGALTQAATVSDGFIHQGGPPEDVKKEFDRVLQLRQESGGEGEFQLWVQVPPPRGREAWRETLRGYGQAGASGVIVGHAPNLLDILRNPDTDDDSQDFLIATG